MAVYISKEAALEKMRKTQVYFTLEKKHVAAKAVEDCIRIVEALEGKSIAYEPEKARRVVSVEPYFPCGRIGRDVMRCGFCQTQIERKDKYCRFCGKRLVDG